MVGPCWLSVNLISSVQLISSVRLSATLWTAARPTFPVHHQLLELAHTHVHWVDDDIQPSHPLSSPSPPALNLSLNLSHLSLQMSHFFASGGQSTGVSALSSVLLMTIHYWSPLGWTGWISLQSKGLSRVFSNTTTQNHQFFSTQLSLQSSTHIHTWLLEKPYLWLDRPLLAK